MISSPAFPTMAGLKGETHIIPSQRLDCQWRQSQTYLTTLTGAPPRNSGTGSRFESEWTWTSLLSPSVCLSLVGLSAWAGPVLWISFLHKDLLVRTEVEWLSSPSLHRHRADKNVWPNNSQYIFGQFSINYFHFQTDLMSTWWNARFRFWNNQQRE